MFAALAAAMSMQMAQPLPAADPACAVDADRRAAMMAASHDAFDQAATGRLSWREVMAKGCYAAAADLIAAYLDRNAAALPPDQTREMNFHAGQVLAMGGEDARAIPFFEAAKGGTAEWNTYVLSQLAYVRHDRAAFDAARAAYASVAPDSPRRAFLDSEAACFGQPFLAALMCAPAPR